MNLPDFKRSAVIGMVAATVFSACDTGAKARPGEYALAFVNRKPIPETLEYQQHCVIVLMSGSMTIIQPDSFAARYNIVRNCADVSTALPDPGGRGSFSMNGDTLFFLNTAGAAAGRGTMRGDTLTVQGPLHELRYIRNR